MWTSKVIFNNIFKTFTDLSHLPHDAKKPKNTSMSDHDSFDNPSNEMRNYKCICAMPD